MARFVDDRSSGWATLPPLHAFTAPDGADGQAAGRPDGVKALMLAVLEDGIRSLLSEVPQIRAEAEYWVTSNQRRSPFSFAIVCECLGLDAEAARRAILGMARQGRPAGRRARRSRPNVHRRGRLHTRGA